MLEGTYKSLSWQDAYKILKRGIIIILLTERPEIILPKPCTTEIKLSSPY